MFDFTRPSFKTGTLRPTTFAEQISDRRRGTGDFEIKRQNFEADNVKARNVLNFDTIQANDIASNGIKVRLSDETLDKLISIQVPDPTDISWIEERKRMKATGMTDEQLLQTLPLGRPQRTVKKTSNLSQLNQANLNLEQKLTELAQEAKAGRLVSAQNRAAMAVEMKQLLTDTYNVTQMSKKGLDDLEDILKRLNIPKRPSDLGLRRFIDKKRYFANKGTVNLFILSNAALDSKIDINAPIKRPVLPGDSSDKKTKIGTNRFVSLSTMEKYLSGSKKSQRKAVGPTFIDLKENELITEAKLGLKLANEFGGDKSLSIFDWVR